MMKLTKIFFLLTVLFQQINTNIVTMNAIKKCDFPNLKEQTAINSCLFKVLDVMRQEAVKGISVFGLPNLEPINLANFTFVQGEGPVRIDSTFRNFLVHGFSNYTLTKFNVDPVNNILTLGVSIPDLFVEGQYTMDGNALLLKIEGDGDMWSKVTNLEGFVSAKVIVKEENGVKILGVTDTKVDFTVGDATTNLSNLFEGDPILDQAIHHLINNNNDLILEGLQPVINSEVATVLGDMLGTVLGKIPVSAIFRNDDNSSIIGK